MSDQRNPYIFFILLLSFFQSAKLIAQNTSFAQFRPEINLTTVPYKKTTFGLDVYTIRTSDANASNMFDHLSNVGSKLWVNHYFKAKVKTSFFVELRTNKSIPEVNNSSSNEYRLGIQNIYTIPAGRFTFSNRIRLEDRMIKNTDNTYINALRPRYKLKIVVGLNKTNLIKDALYFICSDELYFNVGSSVTGYHVFEQTVAEAGFGYCISDYVTVEALYTYRYKRQAYEGTSTTNGIQLTFICNNVFSGAYTKGFFHKK